MSDNYIRGKTGKILGRMDGNWIRSGDGKLVARYDSGDDRTRTREGVIVGNGDLRLFQLGKSQPKQ
jgi:hypothetical protein